MVQRVLYSTLPSSPQCLHLTKPETNIGILLLIKLQTLFGIHQISHPYPLPVPGSNPGSTLHVEVLDFY